MKTIVASGLAPLGQDAPEHAADQPAQYGQMLLEKNQVMNLTAIREPEQVAQLHMLDCAALVGMADFEGKTLIDVGTGAGFPGLPLKILVPSLELTLLDSLNKRLDWLEEVAGTLHLEGVRTVHARAVADLRVLCELCLPYVRPGGTFLAMKSTSSDQELTEAAHAIQLLGGRVRDIRDYTIPGTDVVHRVVVIQKVAPTLKGYPRRWAKMQKAPL